MAGKESHLRFENVRACNVMHEGVCAPRTRVRPCRAHAAAVLQRSHERGYHGGAEARLTRKRAGGTRSPPDTVSSTRDRAVRPRQARVLYIRRVHPANFFYVHVLIINKASLVRAASAAQGRSRLAMGACRRARAAPMQRARAAPFMHVYLSLCALRKYIYHNIRHIYVFIYIA